jgi:hypothetical protein
MLLSFQVGVIGLASKVSFPREPDADSCLHNSMVPVTYEASLHFSSFIDKLGKEDGMNKILIHLMVRV